MRPLPVKVFAILLVAAVATVTATASACADGKGPLPDGSGWLVQPPGPSFILPPPSRFPVPNYGAVRPPNVLIDPPPRFESVPSQGGPTGGNTSPLPRGGWRHTMGNWLDAPPQRLDAPHRRPLQLRFQTHPLGIVPRPAPLAIPINIP